MYNPRERSSIAPHFVQSAEIDPRMRSDSLPAGEHAELIASETKKLVETAASPDDDWVEIEAKRVSTKR